MRSAGSSLDLDFVQRYIDKNLNARQVNKIQHSFPSPRYWLETDVPLDAVCDDRRQLYRQQSGMPVNLYVGVPYCIKTEPAKCGYCLFPVEDFVGNSQLEVYLDYLKREAALYQDAVSEARLGAVYFGGGTSNLYKASKYLELMELVRDLFPVIDDGVDITLEGIPQLFTREKVERIRDAGMNRISMGVQQLNEDLNKLSGRKQTAKHVLQTLDWAREFGLSCNVDLIFGWPRQTVSSMVEDLEALVAAGVYDVTHYELNVGGPTDFALNRYHELPSTLANLEMYRVSRDLLQSHGFEQITAYNWRKPGDPFARSYEEGVSRRFHTMDTLGLGYAAINFFGDVSLDDPISWSYINWRKLDHYKARVDEGRFPVECGFRHEPEDFRLSMLFRNLFALEVDRGEYRSAFGLDAYDEFETVWTGLEERGFVRISPDKIELVGDGVFYTPMIQTLLASARYRALRARVVREKRELPLAV